MPSPVPIASHYQLQKHPKMPAEESIDITQLIMQQQRAALTTVAKDVIQELCGKSEMRVIIEGELIK